MTGAAAEQPRELAKSSLTEWLMRLPADMRCEWILTKYQNFETELQNVSNTFGISDRGINAAAAIRESQYEILEAAGGVRAHSVDDIRRKMALFCQHAIGARAANTLDAGDKLALAILRDLEEQAPQNG